MNAVVLRTPDAAKYIGVSSSWLNKKRVEGGPDAIPFIKLGPRNCGYLVTDLDSWIETRRRMSTSDTGLAA